MPTSQSIAIWDEAKLKSEGSPVYFDTLPERRPILLDGFRLIAVIAGCGRGSKTFRDVSNETDYTDMVQLSRELDGQFRIVNLYTIQS